MKLSEAILLGSMIRPQGQALFSNGKSCAMGAALEANGVKYSESTGVGSEIIRMLPIISKSIDHVMACPVCHVSRGTRRHGFIIVEHLNDFHHWSRERIAHWVASVEQVEESNDSITSNQLMKEYVA